MLKRKTFLRCIGAALLAAALTVTAFADTIRLKDGSIIKGKITSFGGGVFTVVIGEGSRRREMTFTANDIESIEFDNSAPLDRTASVEQKPVSMTNGNTSSNRVVVTNSLPEFSKIEPKRPDPVVVKQTEVKQRPSTSSIAAKPIELGVTVKADNTNNGWTNSGWVVRKGQRIKITGSGEIGLGNGKKTGAGGLYDLEDDAKLLKAVPTGALIAVIGDDNNDFIYVGESREFVATRDGALFLGVNEGNLNDNSGTYTVKIEIAPDSE